MVHQCVTDCLFALGILNCQSSAAALQSKSTRSTEWSSFLKTFAFLAFQTCQQTSAMKVESSGIADEVVFMYQARVDAVQVYYKDVLNQTLDDKLARPIELTYEQYLNGRVKWCKRVAWPSLCRHWCSEEFLTKRKRGQESRLSSDDIAQNRGGSRPFGETRQLLVGTLLFI
jgi:hypothetical protein